MGLEFLHRVRRASLWLGLTTALLIATYRGPAAGLALALGAAWCLVNLFLIEKLIVALTGTDRAPRPGGRIRVVRGRARERAGGDAGSRARGRKERVEGPREVPQRAHGAGARQPACPVGAARRALRGDRVLAPDRAAPVPRRL